MEELEQPTYHMMQLHGLQDRLRTMINSKKPKKAAFKTELQEVLGKIQKLQE